MVGAVAAAGRRRPPPHDRRAPGTGRSTVDCPRRRGRCRGVRRIRGVGPRHRRPARARAGRREDGFHQRRRPACPGRRRRHHAASVGGDGRRAGRAGPAHPAHPVAVPARRDPGRRGSTAGRCRTDRLRRRLERDGLDRDGWRNARLGDRRRPAPAAGLPATAAAGRAAGRHPSAAGVGDRPGRDLPAHRGRRRRGARLGPRRATGAAAGAAGLTVRTRAAPFGRRTRGRPGRPRE